ncbi:MAG: hypothetical protein M1831_004880 [Alyxoria varia]|nr:MAG: hypothetical protein M1831_004880 [Alyxoria varia]
MGRTLCRGESSSTFQRAACVPYERAEKDRIPAAAASSTATHPSIPQTTTTASPDPSTPTNKANPPPEQPPREALNPFFHERHVPSSDAPPYVPILNPNPPPAPPTHLDTTVQTCGRPFSITHSHHDPRLLLNDLTAKLRRRYGAHARARVSGDFAPTFTYGLFARGGVGEVTYEVRAGGGVKVGVLLEVLRAYVGNVGDVSGEYVGNVVSGARGNVPAGQEQQQQQQERYVLERLRDDPGPRVQQRGGETASPWRGEPL